VASQDRDIPPKLRADLAAGEQVISFAWARLPRKHTGYHTFAPIGMVIDVVDLLRSRAALRRARERFGVVGFPLDRRMAMAVTADQLVIWRRGLRSSSLLGCVPRRRIASARLPYIGGSWRIVEVRLAEGLGVRFMVDRDHAEVFAWALNGGGS
jgi:hypothetical protein